MTVCLVLLIVAVASYQYRFFRQARKAELRTWKELIDGIVPLEPGLLKELLSFRNNANGAAAQSLLARLGGRSGLRTLGINAETMLELAMYAERWDHHDGQIFTELMRRDALTLRRAVWKLYVFSILGRRVSVGACDDLCMSYGDLRERLLAVYENTHCGLLPDLQRAV